LQVINNLVALRTAAATAYLALTRREQPPPEGMLDVAAIALSTCIPIYGTREGAEPPRRLSDADLAGGEFTQGASCLEYEDGRAPFTCLAVSAADFATGLARLQHAGVNFSHARYEQAPRRPPTAMPHYMLG
jgi:hypothetical protein